MVRSAQLPGMRATRACAVTTVVLVCCFMATTTTTACSRARRDRSSSQDAVAPIASATSSVNVVVVDSEEARTKRGELVSLVAARGYVKAEPVLDAMRRVPRHLFMPKATLEQAYGDWPFPIEAGQTISQPSVVGEMTEALELRGKERVLEIGTGSGYQAAILSILAGEVFTIEIVRELGERAEQRLRDLGYTNVHVRVGDGYRGWPDKAPFDRVILTAAPPEVPKALTDQLADNGGILVAPVGEQGSTQRLVRIRKQGGKLAEERLDIVRFVPMVPAR
jgi:protein-L-isoaspartate(D-aspartate) O-methyltransferase